MEDYKFFKELCDGYSTQSKLSNNYWVLVMLASIISLINLDKTGDLSLPFSLGNVRSTDFNSFMLLMICTTSIAFASTFLQSSRTRVLIQRLIDNASPEQKFINKIHLQDIFDSVSTPNFNRVAPISQFILGKNQFLGDSGANKKLRHFGTIVYIILKLISLVIAYIVPVIALFKNLSLFKDSTSNLNSWGLPNMFYWLLCIVTFGIYLILIVAGLKYMYKIIKRILKP